MWSNILLELQRKKMKLTSYMSQLKKWQPKFPVKDFVKPNSTIIVRILWADEALIRVDFEWGASPALRDPAGYDSVVALLFWLHVHQ